MGRRLLPDYPEFSGLPSLVVLFYSRLLSLTFDPPSSSFSRS
jgi:hypothetical protein